MLSECSYWSLQKVCYVQSSIHLSLQILAWYTAAGLYITLHSSSARLDGIHPVQIHLIGIRDSPDHRCVRNKEAKFIWIYSLRPKFSVRCQYHRGLFFKYLKSLSGHWKLSVIERCPYREVWLYLCRKLTEWRLKLDKMFSELGGNKRVSGDFRGSKSQNFSHGPL